METIDEKIIKLRKLGLSEIQIKEILICNDYAINYASKLLLKGFTYDKTLEILKKFRENELQYVIEIL